MIARIETVLDRLARIFAWAGGLILVAIAVLTVLSISGRALIPFGLSPIRGDFELVEAGTAIAVFWFLPWCQLRRGHVTVDIFTSRLPLRFQAILGLVGDALMTLAAGVILWRLWLGLGEKFPYGGEAFRAALGFGAPPFFPETTYELAMPVWIPFALATLGAILFFAVSIFTMVRAGLWVARGAEAAP